MKPQVFLPLTHFSSNLFSVLLRWPVQIGQQKEGILLDTVCVGAMVCVAPEVEFEKKQEETGKTCTCGHGTRFFRTWVFSGVRDTSRGCHVQEKEQVSCDWVRWQTSEETQDCVKCLCVWPRQGKSWLGHPMTEYYDFVPGIPGMPKKLRFFFSPIPIPRTVLDFSSTNTISMGEHVW